jgi:phage baseplate assembly protein W
MGHSQFKFKSSGFRRDDRRFVSKKTVDRPVGIKTPLEIGDDIFVMHNTPIRQIADNFRNLVMTNHGERLGMYNFGANLKSLLYDYSNEPNFEEIVKEAIVNTTNKYIPSIVITGIDASFIDVNEKNELNRTGLAKVRIRIEYSVPRFKSPKLGLEVDLVVGG